MPSPTKVLVREATADDVPLILDFIRRKAAFDQVPHWVEATEERLTTELFGPQPKAFVIFAELDGRPVGFACCFFTFSSFLARPGLWLDDLFVEEAFRGKGAGGALLTHLARLAKEREYGRIEWIASVANEKGLEFYRRNGAEIQDRVRVLQLARPAISRLAKAGAA